jgi:hypothetical protein
MSSTPLARALVLALAATLCGCALVRALDRSITSIYQGEGAVTQAELRNKLFTYSSGFDVIVSEAADRISTATKNTNVRRSTLLWKIRMPDAANLAASIQDPREAYVESLTLAIAQRQYFEDGAGQEMFLEQQPLAIAAAKEIESRAVVIGESFLTPDQLEDLRESLEKIALENPIRGEFLREGIQAGIDKAESKGMFDEIFALPMAPFRALEGVDTGAQAISEFNVTAQRATDIVADLPQRIRWQLELLTYDLQEQGGALEMALKSFDTMAESTDRLSLVAESLPAETRATIESAGAQLEQRSAVLNELLAEYRAAMTETNGTITNVAPLMAELAKTAEQVNQAGVAWNDLMTQINAPSPPPPPGSPPPHPFNIMEYHETAQSITKTAEELRLLLGDMQTAEQTVVTAIARRVVVGGAVLIAFFFGALLLYRILAAHLVRPR